MRVQILSDLHLEFEGFRKWSEFINSLDPDGVDVLILAGDICTFLSVSAVDNICKRYVDSKVIWVHGNHEFYGTDRKTMLELTETCVDNNSNLYFLDNDYVTIGGQRFLGAPLWFKKPKNNDLERYMNDFRVIKGGFRYWVYEQNSEACKFLENNVKHDDVVITHHLPSQRSVAPRFKDGDLNCFFVCDLENLILQSGPKLWIHGHTHDSFDYEIEHACDSSLKTRVVCNPRGYVPHELNPDFRKDLIIEL